MENTCNQLQVDHSEILNVKYGNFLQGKKINYEIHPTAQRLSIPQYFIVYAHVHTCI